MEIIVTPKKEQIRIDQVTGKKIKLRVAAYARVSTDLEDQRNSFEFQKEEFESRIKQNPDWEFVKMYADHGISGTQVKHRKGFLQMIHDADNGKIDLILTKSISRFARNTVDLLTYVRKLAAENVSIFFEKENIMTNRDNVNLILTMYASIAESESINISDNVKWGVRKRMKKNSLKVPVKKVIGYSRTDDGTWYLNDDAQLAKNVFIYFLQGYTYRQIVELMKNDDKEGKFQWRPNTIHRILTNEKYKGFVIHQKTVTLDPLTHKQVKNNGIEPMYTIRDHHPKIVDEETFDLIQLILKRGDKETPTHSNYFPLAGLVVCEECGRTLRRIQYAHNKEIVLTCKGRSKQDLNYKECSSDVIPYHAFKEITKKVINEIKQSDSISSSFTMNLVDELSSDNYIPEINKLNRQIEDTKKEINDLVKEQVNSTEMVGYDSKFKILKTKLKNLQNEVIRYENLAKKNFSLIKNKKQIELFLNKNDMDFDIPSMRDIIYQIIHKKDGMIDIILVKSISRFGRNVTDVIGAVHQIRTKGVELFLEKENISSLDASSTVAFQMYAHLAECEAKDMAENVKWSVDNRMKKGIYRLPVESMLGYRYDENGELYIVEEEANIVRLVFDMYLKGLSYQFIIRTMMERGYKTAAGNTKWNESTISGILRNEKYVGDCHLHKTFAPKVAATTMVVNRGEVDDYYVKDGHEPIITRETWDAACALREERREKMGKVKGMKKPEPWPESSFGVCPYCKKNFFIKRLSNANDGIRYTLTCSSNRSTLTCRESESVFVHDLRNIILEQIKIIKNEPLLFKKLMADAFNEDLQPINDKIALINTQIDLLKSKIATYSGKHNEAYKALSDEITEQVENLMNEKKMLENRLLTHENYERMIKETMKTINELSMTEYDPNFRKLFKKVIIKSRTDLTFIIGNENVDNLDLLNLPKVLNSKYQIKVRAQLYNVDFGIYFNR